MIETAPPAAGTFRLYLFVAVPLIAAVGTITVFGAWMLPETVLPMRRIAGAKRRMTAAWAGREIPEADRPLTGPPRVRDGGMRVSSAAGGPTVIGVRLPCVW